MQPVQLSLIPDPAQGTITDPVLIPPPAPTVEQLPADAAEAAIMEFPTRISWDAPLSAHIRQIRADPDLTDVNAGSARTPFHLACRTRTIRQC